MRLRVPARKFFERVVSEVSTWEDVQEVRTNRVTTGILHRHSNSLPDLAVRAREENLFAVSTPSTDSAFLLDRLGDRLDEVDEQVQLATTGKYDLERSIFVALVGADLIQILRSKSLGPASLLWAAATFLVALSECRASREGGRHSEDTERPRPHGLGAAPGAAASCRGDPR